MKIFGFRCLLLKIKSTKFMRKNPWITSTRLTSSTYANRRTNLILLRRDVIVHFTELSLKTLSIL